MNLKLVKNVGFLDQLLRIGISGGFIYAGFIDTDFIHDPFSSYIIGAIGVLNAFIALTRFCPLYVIAGINTCFAQRRS